MATEIILDCDPGHDDAIALFLALASDEIEVAGVTTVAGNQTLEKTTHNARRLLTLADRTDLPVARGMGTPMVRDLVTAPEVHGESGIDGPDLPEAAVGTVEQDAVEFIAETAADRDGLTLVPTGPLTNVGMALRKHPELVEDLDEIVLMGGAVEVGNWTPAAEFNVLVDPEAAAIVFDADVPVTMVGLEVTHEALVTPEDVERFRSMGSPVAATTAGLLDFFDRFHEEMYDHEGVPIHDACAVAEVVEPGIVETERMRVDVETEGEHTDGRTVCDVWGVTDREPNADVGVGIDRDRFVDLLTDALATY